MKLDILSSFCFIIPTIIGIFNFRRFCVVLKLLLITITINGLIDGYSYFQHLLGINSSLLLNLYVIPFMIIWTLPIYKSINSETLKKIVKILTGITTCIVLYLLFQINIGILFCNKCISIIGFNLILINLVYLLYVAVFSDKLNLRDHPLFFISSAFLIYQAFNTAIFVFMNILDGQALRYLWDFRYISNMILYTVITLVFVFYARNK